MKVISLETLCERNELVFEFLLCIALEIPPWRTHAKYLKATKNQRIWWWSFVAVLSSVCLFYRRNWLALQYSWFRIDQRMNTDHQTETKQKTTPIVFLRDTEMTSTRSSDTLNYLHLRRKSKRKKESESYVLTGNDGTPYSIRRKSRFDQSFRDNIILMRLVYSFI